MQCGVSVVFNAGAGCHAHPSTRMADTLRWKPYAAGLQSTLRSNPVLWFAALNGWFSCGQVASRLFDRPGTEETA